MPDAFHRIPDHFKTQKICDQAVKDNSSSLQFVPDWFVTRECMWMWYDYYCDEDGDHWDNDDDKDKFFDWYDGYKKCKVQKTFTYCLASIKVLGLVCQKMKNKRQKNCGG